MNHHAYQWRPIRGRRFDRGRFVGTLILIAALPFGVLQLGPWQLHPLVLAYALSGSLMISKTLRIPKP